MIKCFILFIWVNVYILLQESITVYLGCTPTFELKLLLISCWSESNLSICSWFTTWSNHILRWIQDSKYIWELTVTGASITQVLNQQRQTHQLFAHSQSYQLLQSLLPCKDCMWGKYRCVQKHTSVMWRLQLLLLPCGARLGALFLTFILSFPGICLAT